MTSCDSDYDILLGGMKQMVVRRNEALNATTSEMKNKLPDDLIGVVAEYVWFGATEIDPMIVDRIASDIDDDFSVSGIYVLVSTWNVLCREETCVSNPCGSGHVSVTMNGTMVLFSLSSALDLVLFGNTNVFIAAIETDSFCYRKSGMMPPGNAAATEIVMKIRDCLMDAKKSPWFT